MFAASRRDRQRAIRGGGKRTRTHDKPPRVDDALKQYERLVHPVLRVLLEQNLVVLGQRDAEDDGRDGLEAVDPLLPFRPLPADVEHVDAELARAELGLADARRFCSGMQNVGFAGDVVARSYPLDLVKETVVGGAS